jgi:hypothetical protein
MAKAPKPRGRKAVAVLTGTADGSVRVEVWITDPEYTVDAFANDVKYQRVWFEGKADAQGWKKLVYSADGPTGNPWQIGKIRVTPKAETPLTDLSNLTVTRSES